jgi:O-succinylbenzoic acid--CoA ligase
MKPMDDWLAAAARDRPDDVFLEWDGGRLAFREVDDRVARAAGGLVSGSGPLGVWALNRPETVLALLAAGRAGRTVVPIDPRLPVAEARRRIAVAGVEAMVGGPDLGVTRVAFADLDGAPVPPRVPSPEETWAVMFTSGTSGPARGVRLTWGNLEASAAASALHLGNTAGDCWLAVLPLCHVGGLQVVFRSLRQGGRVYLMDGFDARRVAGALRSVSLASLVPTMLVRILDADPGPYPSLRAALVGGGPTDVGLLARAARVGFPLLTTYGMTETCSQVATAPLEEAGRADQRLVPLSGAQVRIGGSGLIEVRGPMVSPGYLDGPSLGPDGWFPTRDRGRLDPEGRLHVLGRIDDIVVTGGENVDPGEVERAVMQLPGVEEAAVVGVPDPEWGEVLVAVYVGTADPREIRSGLRGRLAGHQIPRRWVKVDELPRSTLEKVDRAAVRRLAAGQVSS